MTGFDDKRRFSRTILKTTASSLRLVATAVAMTTPASADTCSNLASRFCSEEYSHNDGSNSSGGNALPPQRFRLKQ